MHISDSVNPKIKFHRKIGLQKKFLFPSILPLGTVQEGGVSSQMGAPLILTKNRNNSPENSTPTPVDEPTITTIATQTETAEHDEDNAVNGKLDINIKDNSIYNKSENNTSHYRQLNEFKHNYH